MKGQVFYLFTFLILFSCGKQSTQSKVNETETGRIRDVEGNVYKIIRIGNQWWMAENLKVTKYRNGEWIINVTGSKTWSKLTIGAYCYYNNDFNNVKIYGNLYNWDAIHDSRNIAPDGWHVPTDNEWQNLVEYLGGNTLAGGKMKSIGTSEVGNGLWFGVNVGATNESSFLALPGGYRSNSDGTFDKVGFDGYWWSSTEDISTKAWSRSLTSSTSEIIHNLVNKRNGFSLRCIRD